MRFLVLVAMVSLSVGLLCPCVGVVGFFLTFGVTLFGVQGGGEVREGCCGRVGC